jgi:DNA (cytosine-5)-methyltransferase 1
MNFDNYSCDNQMSLFDFTREPISITKPIRLIELFAGYGSQAMALKRIGTKFERYRVVEFDKYAIASYNAVHGTDFPTMDITKVHAEDLNICDTNAFTYLLTYSFPCTDLSVAGKQAGMSKGSGTRSGLLWEVERILTEIRDSNGKLPQILFMENVPQVHSQDNMPDFRKWLDFLESLGYTNYYQDLNAKNYGVAQNRERCFMFSFLGEYNYHFPQPIPLKKKLKDYLEDNVDEKYYINNEKADKLIKQLIDNGTLPQHSRAEFQTCGQTETLLLRGMASKKYEPYAEKVDISTTLCARDYKGLNNFGQNGVIEVMADVKVIGQMDNTIVAMRGRNPDNPSDRTIGSPTEQRLDVNMQGTSNCLTSVQKDNLLLENNIQKVGQISSNGSQCGTVISDNGISANLVAGTHGYANSHIATQYRIRKLTPRECGRLMGVSDEDIDKMAAVNSNTQLYKQFGNSIVVDVMCAMFKNLNIKQGDSNETLQAN